MVNPIIPVATLIARLNAARGKASKLNKELVTESMKPRTRKMKEKELRETVEKAKDLERKIPPGTPGFAMGGSVMQRRTPVTQGLTNLLNKYNTSGPLAGAGNVPRGTTPVQMNRGGDPEFGGRPDYSQYDRGDYVRSQTPGRGPAMMNPGFSFADIQAAAAEAAREQAAKAALPAEPVVSAPAPAQPVTAPYTPAPAPAPIPASVPEPEQVVVAPAPVLEPLPPVTQGPLPPPPPPVMETPLPPPPLVSDPLPVVDVVEPPIEEAPLPPIEEAPLPPPVYTPPPPTEVTVPTEPVFTPPPVAETPDLPDPGMLSDAVVDFDISDEITPQTEGYATTRGMNIAATGDPFGEAVQGEYQMPIYRPQVAAGAMPFLSVRYGRPTASDTPPEPPRSDQYSTGSLGRANYAEDLANWERLYGPVEDYQAPDTDSVMEDTSAAEATGSVSEVPSGTNFYPEPPPVRGTGGIGPQTLYNNRLRAWEQKYGPIEDYYAAKEAAQNNNLNMYLSRQGEEAVAAQYGYTVEELRSVNEDRRRQGLPPLGELVSGIDVNPSF